MMRALWLGLLLIFGVQPLWVLAEEGPDLSIVAGYVEFVPAEIIAGQSARLYARVKNAGTVDATAQVLFYMGSELVGTSQPVSVLADGGFDDVFVDVLVPDQPFNVSIRVGGAVPAETNLANNEILTPLLTPLADVDRDTVVDTADNCLGVPNGDQANRDGDDLGDVCDDVDDRVPVTPPVLVQPVVSPVVPPSLPGPGVEVTSVAPSSGAADEVVALVVDALTATLDSTDGPVEGRSLFGGSSSLSPRASFTYSRTDWRTLEFKMLKKPTESEPAALAWDFGDGTTSARGEVTHTFSAAGVYEVTLAITDAYGNISTDTELIKISFFHLDNPIIILLIVMLFGLLIFLGMYVWRVRRILGARL